MRAYLKTKPTFGSKPAARGIPGFTLTEIIDQFYAEGVVPDFIQADLGEDAADELDADGWPYVDPRGDIRTDPIQFREEQILAGVKDPEPVPAPAPLPPVPDPAPDPTPAPTE